MYTEEIANLLTAKFQEEGFLDCFLIEIAQKGKKIEVFIDSDSRLDFSKCQSISRFLEPFLDEKKWFGIDYILEVSSPGIERPLKYPRQFKKNVGRTIHLKTSDSKEYTGILLEADEEKLKVVWEEIRKEGKKKITEQKELNLDYKVINEAKIQISI